ncbi:Cobalt-zinc-cadmium resistance protein CzcA [Enhygromyxa salina]|uniref:Cobalt-zinc-cadmium resistance protein CzcA n=1 Tax=Enhygromyxa salina TaxID=215803 RepID=A0A0C2A789_9BACT|nr:CusA/CzcA family heavy metal efflux RND transporter [Enhygromyxa salina]KIG19313.1 Cobalt-zinc-cadmium resistance protein CzcA [Enhygromyxa salina]
MSDPHAQPTHGVLAAIVAWSVRRRALVLALVFAFAVVGLISARELELDALPDVTGNQVVILTGAPGLTPSEIERTVTRPVEVAVGGLPGLIEQRSLSRYGISSVTAVFEDGVDPWLARQQVAERIAAVEDLPLGVAQPELGPYSGGLGEVVQLSIHSSERTPAELYELIVLQLAPPLRATPGVVEVNIWGGARRTLDVVADPVALAQAGVSLEQLASTLRESTGAVAGSTLPAGPGQALLRGVFWPTRASELGAVAIESQRHGELETREQSGEDHGQTLRIAELAKVVESARPRIGAATADGRGETVYVMIQMQREANALQLTTRLHELMPSLEAGLPADVTIDMVYDRSVLVEATLRTVATNLLEGAALVVIVLLLMLGSVRAGLLVAAVIPLSMLGAVVGMVSFDVPGNLMSLGAIDFGLLVDGAVVMVERVFHEQRVLAQGNNAASARDRRAQVVGSMQAIARPMTLSVLIIVLVYVPILTLQGVDGAMFRPMAMTVVFALLTSLVLALTFTPAAASYLGPSSLPKRDPALVRFATWVYQPVLDAAIARPAIIAVISVALLGSGVFAFMRSGTSFIPQLDEGDLVIQTTRAPDISLETAIAEAARVEAAAMTVPEVVAVTSRIGSPEVATDIMGLEQADVFVELVPRDQWRPGLTREQLIAELDQALDQQAPGANPSYTQPIQMRFNELLGGSVTDVALSVYGEDQALLRTTAEQIESLLATIPGAEDVRILAPPDVSLIEVRPNLLETSRLDMRPAQVLDIIAALRMGIEVGETWDGPVRVPIRLRLDHEGDAFSLGDIAIATPSGEVVPLSRVAEIQHLETPAMVNRQAGQRRIIVGFNVRGAELGDVVVAAQAKVDAELGRIEGMRLVWGGQYEQLEAARDRLLVVVPIVLVLMFALLIMVFRRFGPAAIIFLNVPFACVGGALALWARTMPISISAAIGFIALSGIAVLNGVVLMSSVVAREAAGDSSRVAARESARERMRPVLMTALVAALGFVPMALATGVGAEVQRPLATVVVGGLVTSTFLTLVLLPALYPWLARPRLARPRLARRGDKGDNVPVSAQAPGDPS